MAALAKQIIRSKLKQKRQALSKDTYHAMSLSCFYRLISKPYILEANTIACYVSLKQEVDTLSFLKWVLDNKKTLVLPKVLSDQKMAFYKINDLSELEIGAYGILEPKGELYTGLIDTMVIPLVGYDKQGYRLGQGGGYYDRYLETNKNTYRVGLAFHFQECEFEHDVYDQPLMALVHEEGDEEWIAYSNSIA